MAVVAVTADNNRIAVATQATDTGTWGNDGGGGGIADEPDNVYQGGTAQSRKVSTSRIGRDYTHGSGTSMTATDRRHWIAKINATNYAGLLSRTSPAFGTKIGSGSGAYYEHYLFGNDNYPALGGWQPIAISPNVSGYRDATSGSPSLTSVLYWSILGDFSATSKSENVIIDAIDIGAGLHLVGGDGASTDAVFQDFVDADEGTTNNRWGYVTTRGPVLYVIGRLAIGRNTTPTAVATVFQDSGVTVVWDNGLVETGFHEILFDLGSATTDIDLTSCSLISTGEDNNTAGRSYTTTEDSRTVLTVTGTSGALDLASCNIDNFSSVTLTSAASLDTCKITNTETVTQSSGTITGCSFSGAATADGVAHVISNNPSLITNCDFTFSDGHAIQVTVAGSYGWNNTVTGYGANGSTDAAILNALSASTADSYSESNQDAEEDIGGSPYSNGVGQSFTGNGGILSRARFYVKKTGSPTGNAFAKLYAHSGTFGTSSVPTGSPLATSEPFDVSTLGTSLALEDFEFSDRVTMTNTTKYVITVEYAGGGLSNYVSLGSDLTSPSHGGNVSRLNGSWASGGDDLCFYVYSGAEVILNKTGGSTPTYRNTGSPRGVTIVKESVSVSLTVVDAALNPIENVSVAVYLTSDNSEVLNAETNASGIVSTSFSGSTPAPIYWRVRESPTGGDRYFPESGPGTISTSGYSNTVKLDPLPPSYTT